MSIRTKLQTYWEKQGSINIGGDDNIMGAATYHSYGFFLSISDKDFNINFSQPCRRLDDNREGKSEIRWLKFNQFQVLIRPIPINIKELYEESLRYIGIEDHDIKWIESNWSSAALGARGVGSEIHIDGIECTQFTYFTTIGGIETRIVEIAYGEERLERILNINNPLKDIKKEEEIELGRYYSNKEEEDIEELIKEVNELIDIGYIYMAYEKFLVINKIYNWKESNRSISEFTRQEYIKSMKSIIKRISNKWKAMNP